MPFDPTQWTFLGDGVYVKVDKAGQVVLSTKPGDPVMPQTIYLESQVLSNFQDWMDIRNRQRVINACEETLNPV